MFRPDKFFSDQKIDLMSDRAVSIDRGAHKLLLGSGPSLDYGHLVLATGEHVTRIIFERDDSSPAPKAVGVEVARGTYLYRASKKPAMSLR